MLEKHCCPWCILFSYSKNNCAFVVENMVGKDRYFNLKHNQPLGGGLTLLDGTKISVAKDLTKDDIYTIKMFAVTGASIHAPMQRNCTYLQRFIQSIYETRQT